MESVSVCMCVWRVCALSKILKRFKESSRECNVKMRCGSRAGQRKRGGAPDNRTQYCTHLGSIFIGRNHLKTTTGRISHYRVSLNTREPSEARQIGGREDQIAGERVR
jgi:hypothetical protein